MIMVKKIRVYIIRVRWCVNIKLKSILITQHTLLYYRISQTKIVYNLRSYLYWYLRFFFNFLKHFYISFLSLFIFACEIFLIKFELSSWRVFMCVCVFYAISSVPNKPIFLAYDEGEITLTGTRKQMCCTILISSVSFSNFGWIFFYILPAFCVSSFHWFA